MRKKPSALINSNITPDSTSETEGSVAFSTFNNIPQSSNTANNGNMKQRQKNVVILPISDEVCQKILNNKVTPTNEIKQSNLQKI